MAPQHVAVIGGKDKYGVLGHTRLLHEAALMGVIVAPPMPAFYNEPQSLDEVVNHSVGRVLDVIGIDANLVRRWTGPPNMDK